MFCHMTAISPTVDLMNLSDNFIENDINLR